MAKTNVFHDHRGLEVRTGRSARGARASREGRRPGDEARMEEGEQGHAEDGPEESSEGDARQLRALQGQYMTIVRRLSKVQKAQVKKLRKTKGYKRAIRLRGAAREIRGTNVVARTRGAIPRLPPGAGGSLLPPRGGARRSGSRATAGRHTRSTRHGLSLPARTAGPARLPRGHCLDRLPALPDARPRPGRNGTGSARPRGGTRRGTALPGVPDRRRNCVIAAHRTSFFSPLESAVVGDVLTLITGSGCRKLRHRSDPHRDSRSRRARGRHAHPAPDSRDVHAFQLTSATPRRGSSCSRRHAPGGAPRSRRGVQGAGGRKTAPK